LVAAVGQHGAAGDHAGAADCGRAAGVGGAVVGEAIAGGGGRRGRLADGDRGVAAGALIVGVAVEGPVHQAAGHVGVAGAVHVQQAAEVRRARLHAGGRAADHAVGGAVVDAAEALDADHRVGLADGDGGGVGAAGVVGVAGVGGGDGVRAGVDLV